MAKRAAKKAAPVARPAASPANRQASPGRPRTFADLVANQEPLVAATARRLRELVMRLEPHAAEHIYGGGRVALALYSLRAPNHVLCGIQPSGRHCLLYIHHVTENDAPDLPLQGSGKNSRHLKLAAPSDVNAKVTALLQLARSRME